LLISGAQAGAQQLFDWGSDPITGPAVPANFTPMPFLRETPNNALPVAQYLLGQPIKAVKIYQQLTPGTVNTVYGAQNVNFTFGDIEGPNALAQFTATAGLIRASSATGPQVNQNKSFVGNFDLAPIVTDPSRAAGTFTNTYAQYLASGANMANESLYPGNSGFKNPGQVPGGTSTSPNIRSALFTLPIVRASIVSASLPAGHLHIPYVNRFNNFYAGLANDTYTHPNGFTQQSFVADAGHGTANQLLSRGDFSAMIAHYRARGVNGVQGLDGGVVGYTKDQFHDDILAGWHFSPFETILNGAGARTATLDTVASVDGVTKNIEDTGVVFSGVYSLTQGPGGAGKLALLVSNLDDAPHTLSILNKIGGKSIPGSLSIAGGQHKLLDFTGAGTQWSLQNPGGTLVFVDNDRNGVGVPEPTMIGGLGLIACLGLGRRRKSIA